MTEFSQTRKSQEEDFTPPHNNWAFEHYNDDTTPPKKPMPTPLTANVNDANPIPVQVFWSMRSPYSYLALHRLLYLASNYCVDMIIKTVYPVAIRMPSMISGPWYKWAWVMNDTHRIAKFEGIPYRWPRPDPIVQDLADFPDCSFAVAPLEEQPYIQTVVRLAAAAQLEGKSLFYQHHVHRMIWDGSNDDWQPLLQGAVEAAGMNYTELMQEIKDNPKKFDDVADKNAEEHVMTGHGGVPNMSIVGVNEPFFGQDRIVHFFYRLMENGLTLREKPVEPVVSRPLHWPENSIPPPKSRSRARGWRPRPLAGAGQGGGSIIKIVYL